MRAALAALVSTASLAACGPIPVARAETECFDQARLAAGPRGLVGVGVGSGGATTRVKVAVSTDWLQGKDPAAGTLMPASVRKSGQPQRQPLYTRPDWKG
ncbi:hypothetical protein [Albidovulum sp.]|uniref:hypothetical protein n=1 Tax=Albidovulum sp. TaxID=1872424 RepID=UPI003527435D